MKDLPEKKQHKVVAYLTVKVELVLDEDVDARDAVDNLSYDIFDEDGKVIKILGLETMIDSDEIIRG